MTATREVCSMETNVKTGEIVSGAIKVHTALGPGLLESMYRKCLGYELRKRGLRVIEEKPIQIFYDGVEMGTGLRLDLLVEDLVIVEVKAVERMIRCIRRNCYLICRRPAREPAF